MKPIEFTEIESTAPVLAVWDAWIERAEAIAGHDLDGSQDKDGYCLDSAYDAFLFGSTPEQYVTALQFCLANRKL